eukprot:9487259-Pyramimonas_sp.AAC.2
MPDCAGPKGGGCVPIGAPVVLEAANAIRSGVLRLRRSGGGGRVRHLRAHLRPRHCTSAPNREPGLALGGAHGALPLENLDNLYGVAPPHQTD